MSAFKHKKFLGTHHDFSAKKKKNIFEKKVCPITTVRYGNNRFKDAKCARGTEMLFLTLYKYQDWRFQGGFVNFHGTV